MTDSPPSDCIIGRIGGGSRPQWGGRARASPKTPIHPSNGYQIMDQDGGAGLRRPPPQCSPGRASFGRNSLQPEQRNVLPHADSDRDNMPESAQVTTSRPSPVGCSIPGIVAAVSQEDENDDEPASSLALDVTDVAADTPIEPRRKRKSAAQQGASKTARRRSMRLKAKALEPLTPDKMPQQEKSRDSDLGDAAVDEPLVPLELAEKMSSSKQSSRRRSIRAQKKVGNPRASSYAVKKRQTKRRRSSNVGVTGKEGDDAVMPTSKKQSPETILESSNNSSCLVLPSPKKLHLENSDVLKDVPPSPVELSSIQKEAQEDCTGVAVLAAPKEKESPSIEIWLSENGEAKLTKSFGRIVSDVVIESSRFDNVSKRKLVGRRSRKRGRRVQASILALLEESNESPAFVSSPNKNIDTKTSGKKARPRYRRDTFDLSKKRGLTASAKRVDLNVQIDEMEGKCAASNPDYVTPKEGSSVVNVDAVVNEISRTFDNELKVEKSAVFGGCEPMQIKSLSNLSSIAIEERMRRLIPEKMAQAYKLPCVSARIFAAMSIIYEDQAAFEVVLPFLLSLVDAEFVSLENNEEKGGCSIKRMVCFSGFDYSSTTTALGAVVGQGGGDLRTNIDALEKVLQQALKLSRHDVELLDVAILCLQCMALSDEASEACSKTMVGYFPSARFKRALEHYLDEFKDVKRYVLSQSTGVGDLQHLGVRYRLNDFIGRSVRFHLRELLNTIPESVVDFNVDDCEERWGRAVDDRSISSIVNFSLEKIHELATFYPKVFDFALQAVPDFFGGEASQMVYSMSRDDLKSMYEPTYKSLLTDISEARSFLFGARACKFVQELLNASGVAEHIESVGGWVPVEAITSTFYNLRLHEGSENEHFVQLREVRNLILMLEDVNSRLEQTIELCSFGIRKLRRKLSFKTNNAFVQNLKMNLAGEKSEHFPLVLTQSSG